jgi:hypothetical protein
MPDLISASHHSITGSPESFCCQQKSGEGWQKSVWGFKNPMYGCQKLIGS